MMHCGYPEQNFSFRAPRWKEEPHIGGGLIHILIVVAAIDLIYNLVMGSGRAKCGSCPAGALCGMLDSGHARESQRLT